MSQTCPYCRETIADSELYRCLACHAPHHVECWQENNGCTVFGCKCAPPDEPKVSVGGRDPLPISPRHPRSALPTNTAFYIARNGQRFGPYSLPDLRRYISEGRLAPADFMWSEGMQQWTTVAEGLRLHSVPRGVVKPQSYMLAAILVTLCCPPFGIVSIVYASQVDSKFNLGDYAGAQAASDSAKNWYQAALTSGMIIIALSIIALSRKP